MKLNEGAFFAICVVALTIICAGSISLDYWNANQIRITYQQAYSKNQDCRIASQQSGFTNSIEKICGAVPKFEDYKNE
jgi:hypothetical protein